MRIGVLTGGGDVPGLNPCVKALVYGAAEHAWQVVGIRRGWAGLLELDPEDPATLSVGTLELNRQNTRTIDRSGGTFLHTSRVDPGRVRSDRLPRFLVGRGDLTSASADGTVDCTAHVLRVLDWLGVDALVPIGGDDTLAYAERLTREGVAIAGIPKTMDNDVFGTDYCLGFSTAVTRSIQFIHQIRSSAGSHERVAIVELFGRHCGETTLMASYLAGADRALIPEVPFDSQTVADMVTEDRASNPSNYAIVTVSEGAFMVGGAPVESGMEDAYGHRKLGGTGRILGEALNRLTGDDILYQQVGYLMRSGAPDGLDLMVADNYAALALNLIESNAHHHMVALKQGVYTSVPIGAISEGVKRVDVPELYDPETYLPRVQHVRGKPMFLY
ncbi:MAG TPA: 6-phosphofructokinase [Chloroflexota bacterium]|nr:6-phosphofructokinase [Chloroflexota bacterium]